MTGYGIGSYKINDKNLVVEIKTLNSKFFDYFLKCPDEFFPLEEKIKKITQKKLKRGKIEIRIKQISQEETLEMLTIKDLKTKMNYLKKITPNNTEENLLQAALLAPKINYKKTVLLTKKHQKRVLSYFQNTLEKVIKFREKEGRVLQKEFIKYLKKIDVELKKIKKRDKTRIKAKAQKIKSMFNSLNLKYDKTRLNQELIYYMEKMDITEEIVRIEQHKKYFVELILNNNQVGKKINFLSQEMLREINTIGSKSNDFQLQKSVILV